MTKKAFVAHTETDGLQSSDQSLVRVIEDVIDVLIAKKLISFTDLPEAAQAKLLNRRDLRNAIKSDDLLDDDDGLI